MKGIQVKKILQENGFSLSQIARRLEMSQQNFSSALNSDNIKSGLLEDIAAVIGRDVPFFYGVDTSQISATASGDGSTAVAGNRNNVNSEHFVQLLTKKDEQIDRLLKIIESLSK